MKAQVSQTTNAVNEELKNMAGYINEISETVVLARDEIEGIGNKVDEIQAAQTAASSTGKKVEGNKV